MTYHFGRDNITGSAYKSTPIPVKINRSYRSREKKCCRQHTITEDQIIPYFKSKKRSESGFKRPFKWYITFVSVLFTMRSVFKKLDPYQTDIEAAERPLSTY